MLMTESADFGILYLTLTISLQIVTLVLYFKSDQIKDCSGGLESWIGTSCLAWLVRANILLNFTEQMSDISFMVGYKLKKLAFDLLCRVIMCLLMIHNIIGFFSWLTMKSETPDCVPLQVIQTKGKGVRGAWAFVSIYGLIIGVIFFALIACGILG